MLRRIPTAIAVAVALAAVLACKGSGSDTGDTGETDTIIGDGETPVVVEGMYWCMSFNDQPFFFWSVEAMDEQGADTIQTMGAEVWLIDDGEYVFEDPVTLICASDTVPRYCEGSLLESATTGPCDGTTLTFEGQVVDEDGNVSETYTDFVVNPDPPVPS